MSGRSVPAQLLPEGGGAGGSSTSKQATSSHLRSSMSRCGPLGAVAYATQKAHARFPATR
eukprot:9468071-Pyramimonas_sp.AAC.1